MPRYGHYSGGGPGSCDPVRGVARNGEGHTVELDGTHLEGGGASNAHRHGAGAAWMPMDLGETMQLALPPVDKRTMNTLSSVQTDSAGSRRAMPPEMLWRRSSLGTRANEKPVWSAQSAKCSGACRVWRDPGAGHGPCGHGCGCYRHENNGIRWQRIQHIPEQPIGRPRVTAPFPDFSTRGPAARFGLSPPPTERLCGADSVIAIGLHAQRCSAPPADNALRAHHHAGLSGHGAIEPTPGPVSYTHLRAHET